MNREKEKIKDRRIPIHFDGRKIVFEQGRGCENFNCSRCKSENGQRNIEEFTGEGMIHCRDCGYYRYFEFKREDNGNFIKLDETKDYSFFNIANEEILYENPYAAYSIEKTDAEMETGTLCSKNGYKTFVAEINNRIKKESNISNVSVSRFVNGEISKEIIFPKAV